MATSADQINTTQLTQLMILNLGSRNACMRALVAHPTDLNAAANWLINHRNDANIDTDPFAAARTTTTTSTSTSTTTTNTNTHSNRYNPPTNTSTIPTQPTQHTQQHMLQQVMNLGYTRDEALRAYTNVSTTDRNKTNKLVDYLVKNPKKEDKKSTYNTYSSNSSYYPYSSSNKKKVYRPVINIDDIKVEKEEICDIKDCECLEHIGIILREYKKFLNKNCENKNNDNDKCDKGKTYEKNGFYGYFLETISGDGEYTLSDVMDDFIHLIVKHDVRYGEFNKVYKYIIGKESLNGILSTEKYDLLERIISCHSLSENERTKLYFGFKSVKEITIQQLCDKMYCYLALSYKISCKLEYNKYIKLDKQYDIPQLEEHKETGKIKEKSISSYIGTKQYLNYLQLLNKQREIWEKYDINKLNKFYCAFKVNDLDVRVDPKELKTKLVREKREKKRKAMEEKNRLKALQDKEKAEKEKAEKEKAEKEKAEQDKNKDKEKDKTDKDNDKDKTDDKDKEKDNDKIDDKPKEKLDDKDKNKTKTDDNKISEPPKPIPSTDNENKEDKKEEKKEEKKEDLSGLESVAIPSVLPPKIIHKKEDKKEFSFGVRYNYWPKDYEDLIGITINKDDAKYKTLKDELIGNGLSAFDYNVLLEKATIYFDTEYCQDTIEAGVNPFGIRLLDKITIEHIISLMVYCNYNKIRKLFALTFIRNNNETNESMINKHSNVYFLGKLLRESIECYGCEAHRSETKVFYHGINMNKRIMSDDEIRSLFIYTPFSTTSSMEICLNNKPELIMELKGYVSKYFDCSWISDLCFEKEQIFCGGTRALTINKCIDFKYGYDHKLFINSMKYIPNIFRSDVSEWKINKNDDMLQETKEMIRNLLYYQLNKCNSSDDEKTRLYPDNLTKELISVDIEQALDQFCVSNDSIRMHYDAMYNHRAYGFLSSLFMTPTRTFAQLNVIKQLFPKINTFSMISTPLTTLTFMYIKSYISPKLIPNVEEEKDDHKDDKNCNNKPQITQIRLIDPKTAAMSIEQVIQAEERSLAQLQWVISSPDQVSLLLEYSDKPVIIKEPTPPPIIEEKKEEKKEEKPKQMEGKKRVRKKVRRVKKKVVKTNEQSKDNKGNDKAKSDNEPGAKTNVSSGGNNEVKNENNKGNDKGNKGDDVVKDNSNTEQQK